MTQSISRRTRERAIRGRGAEPVTAGRDRTIIGVRLFTAVALTAGIGLGVTDLAGHGQIHLVGASLTCFILAGISAALLILLMTLADAGEFYRQGQLNGWMRGWRGQEPEVDDPLLHTDR